MAHISANENFSVPLGVPLKYFDLKKSGHPAIVKWFAREVGIAGNERFRDNTLYYRWTNGCAAKQLVRYLYGTSGPALKRKAEIAKRFM